MCCRANAVEYICGYICREYFFLLEIYQKDEKKKVYWVQKNKINVQQENKCRKNIKKSDF